MGVVSHEFEFHGSIGFAHEISVNQAFISVFFSDHYFASWPGPHLSNNAVSYNFVGGKQNLFSKNVWLQF